MVCLVKALHGHPDSGTFWEERCDESVRAMGFQPLGEEWLSVYTHPELQLVLVVYVGDFKMAGPRSCFVRSCVLSRKPAWMYLVYEVTDRMAADIYTKAFSDSRKWKHACVQIGLLELEMLTDPETLKMVTSSFDPIKGACRLCLPIFGGKGYHQSKDIIKWFLCSGSWEKVEDRVEPALQWERIDKYVERAVCPSGAACCTRSQGYSA